MTPGFFCLFVLMTLWSAYLRGWYHLTNFLVEKFCKSLSVALANENVILFYLKKLFIFREREGEREGEKHQCVVASHMPPPTGHPAGNPGMCPDW